MSTLPLCMSLTKSSRYLSARTSAKVTDDTAGEPSAGLGARPIARAGIRLRATPASFQGRRAFLRSESEPLNHSTRVSTFESAYIMH